MVAGVPGITETLFNLRVEAVAAERKKSEGGESLVYKCSLCNREYRSSKAHAQHLISKQHLQKVSSHQSVSADEITVTRVASERSLQSDHEKRVSTGKIEEGESSDEWEEVNGDEDMAESGSPENSKNDENAMSVEDMGQWDVTRCFFCDLIADGTVEGSVEHMHKQHGFFIPDSEYLKDPRGLLNYLGLKVTKGLMCLYCDERGKQFQSLEAVRKHMLSKSHCKLHYGDEGVEEELEDFYDFSSSFATEGGSQMVVAETVPISLSSGGSELIIRHDTSSKHSIKIIGSREFARYYKQRPRPSDNRDGVLVNSLVARYRSMGLATRQSHEQATNVRETKRLPQVQAESMRSKIGLKNNVIRNLPKNVTH
ncbi:hypothetical protein L7F22_025208 [Adiantum nelumboides]|nr:hypothetical protein [Adiantum nelumboides]